VDEPGGTDEYRDFYSQHPSTISNTDASAYLRLLENCWAMGDTVRPNVDADTWAQWYTEPNLSGSRDRCRILFAINSVGAGRGTMMLWETNPPMMYAELPPPWTSEQESAATHLQRNLEEINAMCRTGFIAARVQILVCEPIPAKWTEWMDAQLQDCGGKAMDTTTTTDPDQDVEDRPSPVQIVVAANVDTADVCHDLKSGFMEKRLQDLILAPPFLQPGGNNPSEHTAVHSDPAVKTTNRDLFSSDHFDAYVAMKWSSLVSIRAVHSFLQASADIAAGASSSSSSSGSNSDTTMSGPSSPFLVPSFVRVSYVSEENSKVAKWRMHGDFFHPAAWEICKDSFDVTWIPNSLSGAGGVTNICTDMSQQQQGTSVNRSLVSKKDCGQWWIYFTELQMPTSPDVYANEITPPPVQGGSNFFWMMTERQRREIVKGLICRHNMATTESAAAKMESCPDFPQAVIPLGDVESFLINFTPNTALGRHHIDGRRPGYSNEEERKQDRQRVKERKQLNDQEDIEKALFDYTIYPAALFHKDATLKAARARDVALTHDPNPDAATTVGPQTIKSSYYDVTITKPRPPVLGWCQAIARRGLCTLYADYFRTGNDDRCHEACGFNKDWTPI
jgi:hypothetical protein